MILPILTDGAPILRRVALPVNLMELPGPMLQGLICDMIQTMAFAHGIGLAAPQVGQPLRLIVMGNTKAEGGARGFPSRVLINPILVRATPFTMRSREGCLSVPGYCGDVTRALGVVISYVNEQGTVKEARMSGLEAACFQHELDHLRGVLFIDKVEGRKIPQTPRIREAI